MGAFVEVVKIGPVTKHEDADTLSVTQVQGGFPAIFRTGQFQEGDLAVYVPVDGVVDTARVPFAFLNKPGAAPGKHRVKASRLRGKFSMGLLVEAPAGAKEGDDVQALLGVEKYESPMDLEAMRGFMAPAPKGLVIPKYDIASLRAFGHLLKEGEEVLLTEKIHGASARIVMTEDGVVHVGSHGAWKKEDAGDGEGGDHVWWPAMRAAGMVEAIQAIGPGVVIYGEIFGQVQDLRYGHPDKKTPAFFRAFDILDTKTQRWAEADELLAIALQHGIDLVPFLYRGPWMAELLSLAEQDSQVEGAANLSEGFVVRTTALRYEPDLKMGRSVWKYQGERYLTRKEK